MTTTDLETVTPGQPLACSVDEAAALLSVGRDSMYELIRTGQIPTFKIGRRRLIAIADLLAFIDTARTTQ